MIHCNIQNLKELILRQGPYSIEENMKIYEIYFSRSPRYLFRAVDKKYVLTQKRLCDVGCSYGMNLFYCTPDSYGIEIDEEKVRFAKSLGINVFHRDVLNDNIEDLPKVEVIWCSAVLEHTISPYIFLKKLHKLLKDNGILVLYVPTIPILHILGYFPVLKRYISGYDNKDHIYAFTPITLKFLCERAGFKTIEVSPFYPGILKSLNQTPFFNRLTGRCVYIGQKFKNQ